MLAITKKRNTALSRMKLKMRGFIDRFAVIRIGEHFDFIFSYYSNRVGYICFHMPSRQIGWFLYASPDAKPETSTFYRGYDRGERIRAMIRKEMVGHNWLYRINNTHAPRHEAENVMNQVRSVSIETKKLFDKYDIFW